MGEGGPRQRWMRSYLKIENTSSVSLTRATSLYTREALESYRQYKNTTKEISLVVFVVSSAKNAEAIARAFYLTLIREYCTQSSISLSKLIISPVTASISYSYSTPLT